MQNKKLNKVIHSLTLKSFEWTYKHPLLIHYFMHWLRKNNVLFSFVENYDEFFEEEVWDMDDLVANSFLWADSMQGHEFWEEISAKWDSFCETDEAKCLILINKQSRNRN